MHIIAWAGIIKHAVCQHLLHNKIQSCLWIRCPTYLRFQSLHIIIIIIIIIIFIIITIFTAKCQRCLSLMSYLLLWLLRTYSSPTDQRLSSILRRCPYHFSRLLWFLSEIDCSACMLLLMVRYFVIWTLANLLKYSISRAKSILCSCLLRSQTSHP